MIQVVFRSLLGRNNLSTPVNSHAFGSFVRVRVWYRWLNH